jgi:site-specific recombinase XerC
MEIGTLLARYEVAMRGRLAAGSVRTYMSRLRHLEGAGLPVVRLIRLEHLEAITAAYRIGRKDTTTALFVAAVRAMFAWAVDAGVLKVSPAARLRGPRRPAPAPKAMSEAALDNLLNRLRAATDSQDWRAVRNETLVIVLAYGRVPALYRDRLNPSRS